MSEDNFKWDDELVKEFHVNAMKYYEQGHSFNSAIKEFKASKTKAKDYEILSFINPNIFSDIPDANIINAKCSEANLAVLRNYPIHSVKRLLDGEIFELHKTRVVDPNTKHEWVISEMYVGRDNQVFLNGVWLNHVVKVKQPIPLSEKPPIGIMPEWLWKEKRFGEIMDAIKRYEEADKERPNEWIDEALKLAIEIFNHKAKNLK